jgi:hypothetical protein
LPVLLGSVFFARYWKARRLKKELGRLSTFEKEDQ